MGSLAAAIRLAAKGFEVEVFEKNDQLGGSPPSRHGSLDHRVTDAEQIAQRRRK